MIRACVIGWPVAHSRSPLIHGFWLKKYGICGDYGKRPVHPDDVLAFLKGMRREGLSGCNVTLPHKEKAFAAAARATSAARAVAAANTLFFEGDELVADNSDGVGFLNHVRATRSDFPRPDRPVALLGAGGAARAIVHALLAAGAPEVRICNRTRQRADALARHFGARVRCFSWHERDLFSRGAGALINATSLGMRGNAALDLDVSMLDDHVIVADIVYVPLITPLLAAARARGLAVVDGLGMLMHQAAPGFHKWFGVFPQVTDELRALLIEDIGAG